MASAQGMSILQGYEQALRGLVAAPPRDRRTWNHAARLLDRVPPEVDPALVDAALAILCEPSSYYFLIDRSSALDAAAVRLVEAREATEEAAAFVASALRAGRGPLHPRLHRAFRTAEFMPTIARAPIQLRRIVNKQPELVEGARTAVAVGRSLDSPFAALVFADGTPASIDVVLPLVDAVCTERGRELDRVRKHLAPLLPDTAATRAVRAMLDGAKAERAATSPARRFAARLGVDPIPARVLVGVTFRDRAGAPVFVVNIDSAHARWFRGRRSAKWQWQGIEPGKLRAALPREAASYVVRCAAALRAPVEAWLDGQLTKRTASRGR